MNIAIIGAGLAGLTLARQIGPTSNVTVFEKSRGVGGRMATRYADADGLHMEFDHGVSDFSAKGPDFLEFMEKAIRAGAAARWPDSARYVGSPRMNALCKWLAQGVNVRLNTHIAEVTFDGQRWTLVDAGGKPQEADNGQSFDCLILTAPAAQTAVLAPDDSSIARRARATRMPGRFSLMLGFDEPLPLHGDILSIRSDVVADIVINSNKPGRAAGCCLVVHSTCEWAQGHMESDAESAKSGLLDACASVLDVDIRRARYAELHRWRYATIGSVAAAARPPFQIDTRYSLAACGDWMVDGRVEGAWTSAMELAAAL